MSKDTEKPTEEETAENKTVPSSPEKIKRNIDVNLKMTSYYDIDKQYRVMELPFTDDLLHAKNLFAVETKKLKYTERYFNKDTEALDEREQVRFAVKRELVNIATKLIDKFSGGHSNSSGTNSLLQYVFYSLYKDLETKDFELIMYDIEEAKVSMDFLKELITAIVRLMAEMSVTITKVIVSSSEEE